MKNKRVVLSFIKFSSFDCGGGKIITPITFQKQKETFKRELTEVNKILNVLPIGSEGWKEYNSKADHLIDEFHKSTIRLLATMN